MEVGHHSKTLTFHVTLLGGHNIILGLLWLQQHDPQLQWSSGKVTFTSNYCEEHCLDQPTSTMLNQCPLLQPPMVEAPDSTPNPISTEEAELFAIEVPQHLVPLKEVIPEEYWDYLDIFDSKKAATTLPEVCGPNIDFAIELDPAKPLWKPSHPYHMNQEEQTECRKVLDEMLQAKWIEPADAHCPIAAPMFFIWKKDGTHQPVINYQKLNDITIKDSYPLPCINEMMDQIRGSELFTKFDLKSGYNQICIRPGDEWKTTFMTPFGPFRLCVMTFGFMNMPPCFQQYMDKVFAPLLYRNLENYLDNALNHHLNHTAHVQGVRDTLQCLWEAKLFCNLKKCKFHQPKIELLGMDISHNGFEMDNKKTSMIAAWQ
jgi:hypothetical protein